MTEEVSKASDSHIGEYKSRIEAAVVKLIAQPARKQAEQRDFEIINQHADALNMEAEDALSYQAPL